MHVQTVDPVNNSSECAGRAACHGAELVFEWDNAAAYNLTFTPDESRLVDALAAVVRQLAAQGYVSWPRFDAQSLAFTRVQVGMTRRSCSVIFCCCAMFCAVVISLSGSIARAVGRRRSARVRPLGCCFGQAGSGDFASRIVASSKPLTHRLIPSDCVFRVLLSAVMTMPAQS